MSLNSAVFHVKMFVVYHTYHYKINYGKIRGTSLDLIHKI